MVALEEEEGGAMGVLLRERSLALCWVLLCCLHEEEIECSYTCTYEGKRRERKEKKRKEESEGKKENEKMGKFFKPRNFWGEKNNKQFMKLV
jgi:hypothetical protein